MKENSRFRLTKENLFFYGSWLLLIGYCLLSNLDNFLLEKHGMDGYSGGGIVRVLYAIFWIISVIGFPIGIIMKFQKKALPFWIGLPLLWSLVLAVSDTFGIPQPFMDEPHMDEPGKRFLSSWGTFTLLFTALYLLPLGGGFLWIRIRAKRKGEKFPFHAGRCICSILLSALTLFLIFAFFALSHT